MNELHHLCAICQLCCCKWLFCIEFPEYLGWVERLLYTNRLSSCYFSGDAWLTRHRGRHIDWLSLSMQSSSLKETLERLNGQLRDGRTAHIKQGLERWEAGECGEEYWLVKCGVQAAKFKCQNTDLVVAVAVLSDPQSWRCWKKFR